MGACQSVEKSKVKIEANGKYYRKEEISIKIGRTCSNIGKNKDPLLVLSLIFRWRFSIDELSKIAMKKATQTQTLRNSFSILTRIHCHRIASR